MATYSPYHPEPDLVPDMTSAGTYPPLQGPYNACQTFGGDFALSGLHRRAGVPIEINRMASFRMAMDRSLGGYVGNNGATVDNLAAAWASLGVPTQPLSYNSPWDPIDQEVRDNAARYKGVVIEPIRYISQGPAKNDVIETLFQHFDRGDFVIGTIRDTRSLHDDARGQSNWHSMDWDGSYASDTGMAHVVTFCGGSRQHGRILFANWWENWGDGGFGGAPFDKFLMGPQGCVNVLHVVRTPRAKPVGVRTVPNAFPTPFTIEQQGANNLAIKAKLEQAFLAAHSAAPAGTNPEMEGYKAALVRGGELNISDKQFEASAPGLQPLPRGTIRSLVDAGEIPWPVGMREEIGI